ncbi:restriction endonuclease subunit S [Aeromonas veronii]|uniref:restriction endonuclease subunit S n=1 Tax=Aeromonas TaxID=642 RepID=UPI0030068956
MDALIDYRGKTPVKTDSGVPLVTAKVIKGGRIETPTEFIAPEDYDSWMRRGIPLAGDVVMTTEAPLGEVAQLGAEQVALAQRVITLRGKTGFLDNAYLLYLLQTEEMQDQLKSRATGTTVLGIKQSELRKVRVKVPPFDLQQSVAGALKTLDDRIALLRETNATLEAIAQALFKSWFVDFDPVHARARGEQPQGLAPEVAALFPDSFEEFELGMVPQGWAVGTLSEICSISSGKRPPERSDELSDECHIPLYGGAGLMGYTSASLFETPRIVTGRVGTLGKVHVAYPPFWASDNVLVLTPAEDSIFAFCLHWVSAIDVHALNRGSSQPLLTQKDLGAQLGVIPLPEVLVQFEATVSPLYKQIRANLEQAQTLANLRDTLLPRLISGQLRLPDAEAMVSEAQA